MESGFQKRPKNPRANCSPFSAFTLSWTSSIFKLGSKKSIELSDVYEPLKEHSSENLGKKSWSFWEAEKLKKNPKIYKVIFKLFKWEIIVYFIFALLRECILRVAQPIFLGYFMSYYVHEQRSITFEQCVLSATCLVICSLLYSVFGHPCAMGVYHLGMKYRATLSSLVYRKSLRLHNGVLGDTNLGHIINLLTNDIRRFDIGTVLLNYLIVSPIQLFIMTYFIWREIGMSSLIGLGVLVAQIPLQFLMGDQISKARAKTAALTDKRVQLINEVVSGIQVIKMCSWGDWFSKLVSVYRQNEVRKIRFMSYLRAINISLRIFNTRLCIFTSLTFYTLLGNEINAQKVFVTVCFYEILKQTMTVWFPDSINQIKELNATFKRFETFLLKEETLTKINHMTEIKEFATKSDESSHPLMKSIELSEIKFKFVSNENNHINNTTEGDAEVGCGDNPDRSQVKNETTTAEFKTILSIKNLFAKWNIKSDKFVLQDICLDVTKGNLVAVTGCVASGKSSLLNAILRELYCVKGLIECRGSISYSSQVPWLFVGTVKQNIVFGSDIDEEHYDNVCKACALERDFEMLPDGDLTVVGDRGMTLSGGQRGRISLARAIYRNADIYLLDDPLSAVDTLVGRQLFDYCIESMLRAKGKTVVLVTHQMQYLNEADYIIVLKDGSVASQGTFQSLTSCEEFSKFVSSDAEVNGLETTHTVTPRLKNKATEKKMKSDSVKKSIDSEDSKKNKVEWRTYKSYVKALGTKPLLFLLLLLAVATQFLASSFDFWTKYWASLEEMNHENNKIPSGNESVLPDNITSLMKNTADTHATNSTQIFNLFFESYGNLTIYFLMLASLIVTSLSRSMMFYWMAMKASLRFHQLMFNSVIRATMSFFYHNSSGTILNRFSQDIGAIDDLLPLLVVEVIQVSLQLLGIVIIVSIVNPWLFIPMIVIVVIINYIKNLYIKTSRSITRCEAAARSFVFSHLSSSMQGLTTIRAMSAEDAVTREFDHHNDLYSSTSHMFIGVSRAFAYWLDLVCVVFIGIVTYSFLFGSEIIGGNIGLAITQVIGLTTVLQWGVRQAAALENQMISVERVDEYSNIYPEPPLEIETDKELVKNWPHSGQIEIDNVYLTYSREDEPSLNGVSLTIEPKQKIGIIGRTGAGKTSIINALFRLNSYEGKIKIDDVNITKVGLHTLRSNMSIIPQEPILFSGTLRKNLDPFDKYDDELLYGALEQVELKGVLRLDHRVAEGGNNLSVGERQLICLARSIIRGNKIIVLDEATANVDNETDSVIQATIREKFADCTIITIAHRLHTILDSDKIIVMDAGRVIECGRPIDLLNDEYSIFYSMVEETGSSMGQHLKKMIEDAA